MEEIWNHPASIYVYSWLMCKVTSTDLCNVFFFIAFYHLMFFNKYFTKKQNKNNNSIFPRLKTSADFIEVSITS